MTLQNWRRVTKVALTLFLLCRKFFFSLAPFMLGISVLFNYFFIEKIHSSEQFDDINCYLNLIICSINRVCHTLVWTLSNRWKTLTYQNKYSHFSGGQWNARSMMSSENVLFANDLWFIWILIWLFVSVLNISFLIVMMEFQRKLKEQEDDDRLP